MVSYKALNTPVEKQELPNEVAEGKLMAVNFWQKEKQSLPNVFMLGKEISVRPLHKSKQLSPKEVTEDGTVTDLRL